MATETTTQPRKVPMLRFPGLWASVAGTAQACLAYWGSWYGWTVAARFLRTEMGYSATELGLAGSAGRAVNIVGQPFGGWVGDRWWGPRWGSIGFFVFSSVLLMVLALLERGQLWLLVSAYPLSLTAAWAAGYRISWPAVNRWWIDRRVLMVGLVVLGGGSSGVWGPPATAWLVGLQGWRGMLITTGIVTIVIAVAAAFLYPSGRPEDHGFYPDNLSPQEKQERAGRAAAQRGRQAVVRPALVDIPTAQALRGYAFWMLTIAGTVGAFAGAPISLFQNIRMGDLGYSAMEAAFFYGLRMSFSYVGRVGVMLFGDWFSARWSPRYLLVIGYLLEAVGHIFFAVGTTAAFFWAWAATDGIGFGILIPGLAAVFGSYFGRVSFGFIYGLYTGISGIGAVVAPTLVGWLSDVRAGDWVLPFLIIVGGYFLAAVLYIFCYAPKAQAREQVR